MTPAVVSTLQYSCETARASNAPSRVPTDPKQTWYCTALALLRVCSWSLTPVRATSLGDLGHILVYRLSNPLAALAEQYDSVSLHDYMALSSAPIPFCQSLVLGPMRQALSASVGQ